MPSPSQTRFVRATPENKLFEALLEDWGQQCETYGEDFGDYAQEYLKHAKSITEENPQDTRYGIFLLTNGALFNGLSHFNRAQIKRTSGWTLRILWTLMAPRFDFETQAPMDVARVTADVLHGAMTIAKTELPSNHIKLHMNGVPGRMYLQGAATLLESNGVVSKADISGNWLVLSDIR